MDQAILNTYDIFSYAPKVVPASMGDLRHCFSDFKLFIKNDHKCFMRTTASRVFSLHVAKRMSKFCLPAIGSCLFDIKCNEENGDVTFMLPLSIDVSNDATDYCFDKDGRPANNGIRSARIGLIVVDKENNILFGGLVPFQNWRKCNNFTLVRYGQETKKHIVRKEKETDQIQRAVSLVPTTLVPNNTIHRTLVSNNVVHTALFPNNVVPTTPVPNNVIYIDSDTEDELVQIKITTRRRIVYLGDDVA